MVRRSWFSVLARLAVAAPLLLVVPACGGDDSASSSPNTAAPDGTSVPEPITIRFASVAGISSNLPVLVAEQEGYFEEEGITLEWTNIQAAGIEAAVVGGTVDMSISSVARTATMVSEGIEVRLLSGVQPLQDTNLMVPVDSDIEPGTPWEDVIRALEGRPIGTSGLGTTPHVYMNLMFEEVGLSEGSYTPVNAGVGSTEVAALTSGEVEATVSNLVTARLMEAEGQARSVLDFGEAGPSVITDQGNRGFIALASFVEDHPDVAERFQRALAKGVEFAQDPANLEVVKAIALEAGTLADGPHVDDVLVAVLDNTSATFEESQLEAAVDYVIATGAVDEGTALAVSDFTVDGVIG